MANLLYVEPTELTLHQFREKTGWSWARIAQELGEDERTLYRRAHKDASERFTQWRKHLALIYKVSKGGQRHD